MSIAVGDTVGPYRISDRLGQGGMATVFRAYHPNLDRYVAIKVLHPALKEDPNFLARFTREAQIIAKLEHPSIVPIYDYAEHLGEPYLVMKFIEGETLKARLSREPLNLDETLRTMTAVAEALSYAHERGILHRDVKPSNILLERGVTPYLADFGLARMASAGESTLSQDQMLGTPQYISPEQAQGVKDLTGATDVYSLGVVLYELVVGRVPFNADTPYAIVHDHIFSPLPMPSKVNPQVPSAVERVLLKGLAKDRADRYATPTQMIEAFREAVRESNMTELSAGKYRVPVGVPFATGTSSPMGSGGTPAIPSPMAFTASPEATAMAQAATQHLERQQRRRSLWVLGGFTLLILTCLGGLIIVVSSFATANQEGLFAAPAIVTQVSVNPTKSSTIAVPQAATAASTASSIGAATGAATADNSTVAPTATQVEPLDIGTDVPVPSVQATADATPFAVLSVEAAQALVDANPTDPATHFELFLALSRDNRVLQKAQELVKGQQEFQTGMRLIAASADSTEAIQMARTMAFTQGSGITPVFLYAEAFAMGAGKDPSIRNEAGQYVFRFAQSVKNNKRDTSAVSRLVETIQSMKSAPLFAFAALALYNIGDTANSAKAMTQAGTLDGKLAEVHLIQGILDANQNKSADAQTEIAAALAAPNAPDWVVNVAKQLSAHAS
ncbi:MAG TPA: serine/threonine-protein kinase [Aggregatilineales bacterium]|nr:serine/threonine-protein kinase [Aggregatilineales bacterium]